MEVQCVVDAPFDVRMKSEGVRDPAYGCNGRHFDYRKSESGPLTFSRQLFFTPCHFAVRWDRWVVVRGDEKTAEHIWRKNFSKSQSMLNRPTHNKTGTHEISKC
jgi:hypothetical protein